MSPKGLRGPVCTQKGSGALYVPKGFPHTTKGLPQHPETSSLAVLVRAANDAAYRLADKRMQQTAYHAASAAMAAMVGGSLAVRLAPP